MALGGSTIFPRGSGNLLPRIIFLFANSLYPSTRVRVLSPTGSADRATAPPPPPEPPPLPHPSPKSSPPSNSAAGAAKSALGTGISAGEAVFAAITRDMLSLGADGFASTFVATFLPERLASATGAWISATGGEPGNRIGTGVPSINSGGSTCFPRAAASDSATCIRLTSASSRPPSADTFSFTASLGAVSFCRMKTPAAVIANNAAIDNGITRRHFDTFFSGSSSSAASIPSSKASSASRFLACSLSKASIN